ncbi:hypothetical protein [Micromonospora aurantiaca (nom. illeg.)]|uniref:hypothetical protein n=1 Tax=Micromonospora aurantiaca (nom. illeg.) TaxID=47850 RepID=UPI0034E3D834
MIGGTWFVGHAIVTAAIEAGWEVTTFNRDTAAPFLDTVRSIRGDRNRSSDIAALASFGTCDAVGCVRLRTREIRSIWLVCSIGSPGVMFSFRPSACITTGRSSR